MKTKVAILYICTGKYFVFWRDFFDSLEKNFLRDCIVEYFVFTDNTNLMPINEKVHLYYVEKFGWPFDTLLRFHMFNEIEDDLRPFDYVIFLNTNVEIREKIMKDILPVEEDLIAVLHPGFYGYQRKDYTYETNPASTAYIGIDEGHNYFCGVINGGKTQSFLKMSKILTENIETDLRNKIIAIWHDESLNRYFVTLSHKVCNLKS